MNSHFWLSILPILGPPSHQGPFTQRHQLQRHYQRLSEGRAVAACAEFAAGHAGTRGAAAPGRDAWDAPSYGHWKDDQLVTLVDSDGFGAEKNADVQRNSNTGFKKNSNKLEIEWDSVYIYIYGVVGFVSYHILYHTWIKTGILWASF